MRCWQWIAAVALLAMCLAPSSSGAALPDTRAKSLHTGAVSGPSHGWVELLSWKPRAFLYRNFLSEAEADHIVSVAKPWMKRSTVVGFKGDDVVDNIRTSYGMFLRRLQDPTISAVERRVAEWTKLNVSHQEDIQVLRYGLGQKYGAHSDVLADDNPRVATVLLFLSSPKEGGETAFPQSNAWLDDSLPERLERESGRPWSPCAAGHVAVPPRKGDALLFFSLKVDGDQDFAATHTGCPVIKGVKWTATKWIHAREFRPEWLGVDSRSEEEKAARPEDCANRDPLCADWAKRGECEKNKKFMIGDSASLGACRAACNACEVCEIGNYACKNRNREQGGYLQLTDEELAEGEAVQAIARMAAERRRA